jgi:DNA-binding transcriptional MerR regulator
MPDAPELVPIGRFATASRLSLKALRIYDRLGLLRPAHVDAESGYRYYRTDQLRAARLVALLRRLDMPLDVIKRVGHGEVNDDSNGPVEVCLPVERGSLEPSGDIRLIDLPAGTEAYTTITREQTHFPEILDAYDALHTWIKRNNHRAAASPREIYFADESQAGPNDPFCDVAWPFT